MMFDFDDVTHSIIISGGCQNCAADYELFTLNPIRGWDKFTFAGVFNDEVSDRLQFIFPEWSEDKFHFYTFNYHTSTFNADYDGMANRTYTKNSNGTILLSTNIPAFAQSLYSEWASENKHM
jgi:hypothetical protein